MIRIHYNDEALSFEKEEEAKDLIEKYNLILYKDDGDIIISHYSTESIIQNLWSEVLTEVALYFQANLQDEIISKNLLLVFCASDNVSIDLKKKIQSDTYCCRKIVRSNVSDLDRSIKDLVFYNTAKSELSDSISLRKILEMKHQEVFNMMEFEDEI